MAFLPRRIATPSNCGRMDQACAFGSGVCVTMYFDGDEMKCEEAPVGSERRTTTNGDESTSNSNRNIDSSGGISSNSSKNNNKEELFYIVLCDLEGEKNTVKILKDLQSAFANVPHSTTKTPPATGARRSSSANSLTNTSKLKRALCNLVMQNFLVEPSRSTNARSTRHYISPKNRLSLLSHFGITCSLALLRQSLFVPVDTRRVGSFNCFHAVVL